MHQHAHVPCAVPSSVSMNPDHGSHPVVQACWKVAAFQYPMRMFGAFGKLQLWLVNAIFTCC